MFVSFVFMVCASLFVLYAGHVLMSVRSNKLYVTFMCEIVGARLSVCLRVCVRVFALKLCVLRVFGLCWVYHTSVLDAVCVCCCVFACARACSSFGIVAVSVLLPVRLCGWWVVCIVVLICLFGCVCCCVRGCVCVCVCVCVCLSGCVYI